MEHTPGPWKILEVMGKRFVAADVTEDHPYFKRVRYMDVVGEEDYPRKEADLAVFAAAPTMLLALETVLAHVEDEGAKRVGSQCTLCYTYRGMIREVIRQAKGKTQ